MKPLRLLPWLGVWLLAMIALMATPAMAQGTPSESANADSSASSAQAEPTSYEALAGLLENEQSRQELIDMLRNQASALPADIATELSPEAAAEGSQIG
ncbi:MAG: mechanosensitive ion channel protein MscS, partial [Halomonas sp.]